MYSWANTCCGLPQPERTNDAWITVALNLLLMAGLRVPNSKASRIISGRGGSVSLTWKTTQSCVECSPPFACAYQYPLPLVKPQCPHHNDCSSPVSQRCRSFPAEVGTMVFPSILHLILFPRSQSSKVHPWSQLHLPRVSQLLHTGTENILMVTRWERDWGKRRKRWRD